MSEGRDLSKINFTMSEDNVRMQIKWPWVVIGTDAGGVDPDSTKTVVHPRAYGTYPRILGRYVREQKLFTLEEAVRKMTGAVATRLGLRDRGLLARRDVRGRRGVRRQDDHRPRDAGQAAPDQPWRGARVRERRAGAARRPAHGRDAGACGQGSGRAMTRDCSLVPTSFFARNPALDVPR